MKYLGAAYLIYLGIRKLMSLTYEQRFFDLLRNQSHQNLAALSTHISQARKTIFDRLELVNQSLSEAEFNTGTYLHIDAADRNLDEVRGFKQEIQQALSCHFAGYLA